MASTNTKTISTSGGTYDSGANVAQNWIETGSATSVGYNIYAIQDNTGSSSIKVLGSGDVIYIEGNFADFQYKQNGKTITLDNGGYARSAITLSSMTNKVQVSTTLVFLDGSITLTNKAGGTKVSMNGLDDNGNAKSQALTTTYKDVVINADDSNTTAATYFSNSTNSDSFDLTTGADTAVGSYINGELFLSAGTFVNTLNNADTITGTSGTTDTLFAQITGAATTTPSSIVKTEIVNLEFQGAATISLANNSDASVTTINVSNNSAVSTVSNIQSAPTAFGVSTTDQNATFVIANAALTGAANSTTLTLTSVTAGTTTIGTTTAASGYETINIVSTGSLKNGTTTDLVLDDGLGTSLATVNISGSTALDLDLTPTTVVTVNASTMTGALDIQLAGANGQNVTVTGGTGNDIIDVAGYTTSDTINGGAGTNRLVLTNAQAIAAATVQSNVSNIQVIGLSDGINGTVTLANFGATGLRFGADMGGASTIAYASGTANTLDLQTFASGGAANDLTGSIAGTATTDVLAVTMGSTTAGNTFGAGDLVISGAETVNLLSQGGANSFGAVLTLTNTAATQTLNITGDQSLSITGITTADVINASGMTGSAALTLTGGTAIATVITGSANDDTLTGSTAGDIISGGAGNDTIANVVSGNAATAGDILTGGAGFDTFIARGALASAALLTSYGNATAINDFVVGSTAATTDILSLSTTIGNYAGGTAFNATIAATTAVAAGSTVIQTVAQNAAAAAIVTSADLIKLSTGVATTGLSTQQAFNAAIGSATVTGITADADMFVSFYDTTNSKMVVGLVDAHNGDDEVIETADVITLIGSIDMTAADYASFSGNNLALVAA